MVKEYAAKVKEVIQRTYNVKSVRLEIKEAVDYKAGQFLCATLLSPASLMERATCPPASAGASGTAPLAGQGLISTEPVCKRYLSISSSPTEKGYIEFTKKLTESDFSRALDTLKPQDSLKIQYPFGKFTLDDQQAKIAFLSGGIGITPIRSICKFVADKKLGTDIVLLYANLTYRDIVFKEDFEEMQIENPKMKVVHVLCESSPDIKCVVGRIDQVMIKKEIPDYLEREFFLCGPPGMVEAMKKILGEDLGLPKENIITENFQGYN